MSYQNIVYQNQQAKKESARIEAEYIRRNTIHKTREPEMGYMNQAPGLWRFVSLQDGAKSVVGQQYSTKAALLADCERYLASWGY